MATNGGDVVNLTLGIDGQYHIRVTGETTAQGNPFPLPTLPFTFQLSDGTLGTFTADADGLGGAFVAAKAGSGTITITDPVFNAVTATSSFTIASPVPTAIQFTESAPSPS
jgi:hypothetical protein